ncbi:DUF982 domain-containing protein [Rhizobium sp. LCM 4573]|uniref:DUF982 domain-containing protein n=1 Tax=Rhizobium sp. LCM 4573 TaxID=1848291 RepID=UPI0009F55CDF|nr:DUF982 domain-containing protein [Rhizobium sp. LCM 4573]
MNMTVRTSGTRWLTPVYVRIGYGMPEGIRSSKEALNYLLFRWPAVNGPAYERAKSLCSAAIGHDVPSDDAREAFVRACIEAKVLD